MHQTPAPTRPNARQSAPWRISGLHVSPPRHATNQAADSMLFLSKSRLFRLLPTKFLEYPKYRANLSCFHSDAGAPKLSTISWRVVTPGWTNSMADGVILLPAMGVEQPPARINTILTMVESFLIKQVSLGRTDTCSCSGAGGALRSAASKEHIKLMRLSCFQVARLTSSTLHTTK
jgi:hypothetical protein